MLFIISFFNDPSLRHYRRDHNSNFLPSGEKFVLLEPHQTFLNNPLRISKHPEIWQCSAVQGRKSLVGQSEDNVTFRFNYQVPPTWDLSQPRPDWEEVAGSWSAPGGSVIWAPGRQAEVKITFQKTEKRRLVKSDEDRQVPSVKLYYSSNITSFMLRYRQ